MAVLEKAALRLAEIQAAAVAMALADVRQHRLDRSVWRHSDHPYNRPEDQSAGRGVCPPRPALDQSRLGQERTMTNLTTTEPTAAERADETFTCCETPMSWPARTEDRTCPECGTVWERDGVDLGAGARIKPEPTDFDLVRQAPADRPYWLPGPCPAWCAYPDDHQPHDHPDDRVHMGITWDVSLTLEDPTVNLRRDPAGQIEVSIPH